MNIGECILVGLGMIIVGIVALVFIAAKYDLLNNNDKKNKK